MKKCTGVVVLTSLWLGAATAMASQPFTIADPESGPASILIGPEASEELAIAVVAVQLFSVFVGFH
jgi:hypothetical protein